MTPIIEKAVAKTNDAIIRTSFQSAPMQALVEQERSAWRARVEELEAKAFHANQHYEFYRDKVSDFMGANQKQHDRIEELKSQLASTAEEARVMREALEMFSEQYDDGIPVSECDADGVADGASMGYAIDLSKDEEKLVNAALSLTPTRASEIAEAKEAVCEAAKNAHFEFFENPEKRVNILARMNILGVALTTLADRRKK